LEHRVSHAKQVKFLPDPFTAKAVTRDTCLMSGVTAGETARVGGVAATMTRKTSGRKVASPDTFDGRIVLVSRKQVANPARSFGG